MRSLRRIVGALMVLVALATGTGIATAQEGDPPPTTRPVPPPDADGAGAGDHATNDGQTLIISDADAWAPGSESSGASVVSLAPSPYQDCAFRTAPLSEIMESYVREVFDPSIEQSIRDSAYDDPDDGTVTGDDDGARGPFNFLRYLYLLVDYLQVHEHFLNLAGDDLADFGEPFVLVTCPPGAIRQENFVWAQGDPPPASLVDAYRDQAYEETALPGLGVRTAPTGTADAPLVVKIPTWLWSDPGGWAPVQAVAGIPGVVEVTTTAVPTTTRWDPGSGDEGVTCAGPGRPWSRDLPPGASPSCSIEYSTSSAVSPTDTFTLTRSTRWEVTWVCEPACGGGPLLPLTVNESRTVSVAEIQAIATDD